MAEPTFKELKAAAKELNKFIDPKQGEVIKTVAVKSDVLKKDLIEAAKELGLTPEDDLSEETIAALSGIGVDMSDFEIGEIGENDTEEIEDEEETETEEIDNDELPVDDDLKDLPPTKQELAKTAKELNKLLGLEEPIAFNAAIADLTDEIVDVCGSIKSEEFAASAFTETALDVLEKLGVKLVFAEEKLEEEPVEATSKPSRSTRKKSADKAKPETETAVKSDKAKPKAKTAKKETDLSKSNKAQLWIAWKMGKGETDPIKLEKLVGGAVKLSKIKSWLKGWEKKDPKRLPAYAKKVEGVKW